MNHAEGVRARLALATRIKRVLGETLPTTRQQALWLRMLADQLERDAARAQRNPRERFPIDVESPEGAFLP